MRTEGRVADGAGMSADLRLRQEIDAAFRKLRICEARYHGLVRALVSDQSVLWYTTDAELQREFEAGFDAGRALRSRTE